MKNRKVKFRKSDATKAIEQYLNELQEKIEEVENKARNKKAELDALKAERASLITARDNALKHFTVTEDEPTEEPDEDIDDNPDDDPDDDDDDDDDGWDTPD